MMVRGGGWGATFLDGPISIGLIGARMDKVDKRSPLSSFLRDFISLFLHVIKLLCIVIVQTVIVWWCVVIRSAKCLGNSNEGPYYVVAPKLNNSISPGDFLLGFSFSVLWFSSRKLTKSKIRPRFGEQLRGEWRCSNENWHRIFTRNYINFLLLFRSPQHLFVCAGGAADGESVALETETV